MEERQGHYRTCCFCYPSGRAGVSLRQEKTARNVAGVPQNLKTPSNQTIRRRSHSLPSWERRRSRTAHREACAENHWMAPFKRKRFDLHVLFTFENDRQIGMSESGKNKAHPMGAME